MEWKLTEGDSAPKIKVKQKRKVLLCSCYFYVDVEKNISAHAQSVDVTESIFTASDNDFEDAYLSWLSLVFRHWVTNRLSTMPCTRMIIESYLWKPRKAHCEIKDHS